MNFDSSVDGGYISVKLELVFIYINDLEGLDRSYVDFFFSFSFFS